MQQIIERDSQCRAQSDERCQRETAFCPLGLRDRARRHAGESGEIVLAQRT
jgi:hypothetical protein